VSAIITWSSENKSFDSCGFLEGLIPDVSCFCHLVIISSKYVLISTSFDQPEWLWVEKLRKIHDVR
jgi:hypothetical protein